MKRNTVILFGTSTVVTLIILTIIFFALITEYPVASTQNEHQFSLESSVNQLISQNLSQNIQIIEQENQFYINWRILSYDEFNSVVRTFDKYKNKHFNLSFEGMVIDDHIVKQIMKLDELHSIAFTSCQFHIREGLKIETQALLFSDMLLNSEILSHITLKDEGELAFRNCKISPNEFVDFITNCFSIRSLLLSTSSTKSLLPAVEDLKDLQVLFLYDDNIDFADLTQLILALPKTQIWLNGEEVDKQVPGDFLGRHPRHAPRIREAPPTAKSGFVHVQNPAYTDC